MEFLLYNLIFEFVMASAVSVSGEEDREQIQCGDTETTDHE